MKKLIIILPFLVAGCATTKDNKAVTRVLASTDLSDKVYSVLVKQHPISLDTVYKFINGKPVISYDTIEKPTFYTDTVIDMQPGKVKNVTQLITKYVHSVDTLVKNDPIALRQLASANNDITVLKTQLQSTKDLDLQHKRQRNWYLAGGIVSVLLGLFFIILLLKRK